MKTKPFLSVSRLTLLALICIFTLSLAACSGGDDEPSVDELLSEETTPITFDLTKTGTHFLFDYAGNRLVVSDTIDVEYTSQKSRTIDLRQGKHRLLWMRGLKRYETSEDDTHFVASPYYDTTSRMVMCQDYDWWLGFTYPLPQYSVMEKDVTPYLMPEQKVEYQPLCGRIYIRFSCDISSDERQEVLIYGVPFVKGVSIEDSHYVMGTGNNKPLPADFQGSRGKYNLVLFSENILCPKDGLDNIRLSYEVKKGNDVIYSSSLPSISLHRGYETSISGPLTGGTITDFTVKANVYDGQ